MPLPRSLDDALALQRRLAPGDAGGHARLRDALAELALGNGVSIAAQPLVARAVRALRPLADGTAADAAAARAEVGALLERAAAATPQPPPPPTPQSPSPSADAHPAADVLPLDLDAALARDFLAEGRECVADAEAALLALEQAPDDAEAVNRVFRAFHTVKGTSAFFGFARVSAFAHEAESLLARVRGRELAYTRPCADLALRAADMLRALLDAVDGALRDAGPGGPVPVPEGHDALARALAAFAGDGDAAVPAAPPATPADGAGERRRGDRRAGADRRQGDRRAAAGDAGGDASVRVRTDRLDRLVDLVGELVIAQAMIAGDESLAAGQRHELAKKVAHAGKIVRELQDLSMSMRMVPLRPTFQRLARLVRDLVARTGKDVDFVAEGEDTEIDRHLVDVLGDPLVHMVRNALDHGIETPEARAAAGKPRRGRLRLAASQSGGSVIVELQDDGRGLERERIARKAIEKGLIDSDRGMSDAEVVALIFAPGFSTADRLTDISGRGVGMDVVKRNIESVRGRVEIASTAGEGTTFSVRLPLTLAVTDGMLVRVGRERYVVPTTNIHMSFRPEAGMLQSVAGRGEVVLLRGEVMPVVRLHRLFDVPDAEPDPTRALLMIVGDGGQRRSALLVDELLAQQQVVAKSLGDGVGAVPGVAGGAILGDGRVGLILDVAEILALAQRGDGPEARRCVA